jgi:hypothetical protein
MTLLALLCCSVLGSCKPANHKKAGVAPHTENILAFAEGIVVSSCTSSALAHLLQHAVLATQTAGTLPATLLAAAAEDMPTSARGAAAASGTKIVLLHR